MSRYETAIDLDNPNNSQTQLITLVGRDKRVLDVGCAAGDTARALIDRGCTVSGVDIDATAAEPARAVLEELVIADIDRSPLSEHFKADSFDAVVFGDVLEHLLDPWAALRDAAALLRPGGQILVSIPNVAHGAVRLALLQGRWDYTDKGLLDRTHVRFFTLETFCDLLESTGLAIEVLRATVLDPLAAEEISVQADRLPAHVIEWARQQPEALAYQYVASARVLAPGQEREPRPALEPVVPYDLARVHDKHTEDWQADLDERHRMLTVRDHVIGLEASLHSADGRTGRMRVRAKQAERRFRMARNELEAVTEEIEVLAGSRRPHAGLRELARRLRAEASGRRSAQDDR